MKDKRLFIEIKPKKRLKNFYISPKNINEFRFWYSILKENTAAATKTKSLPPSPQRTASTLNPMTKQSSKKIKTGFVLHYEEINDQPLLTLKWAELVGNELIFYADDTGSLPAVNRMLISPNTRIDSVCTENWDNKIFIQIEATNDLVESRVYFTCQSDADTLDWSSCLQSVLHSRIEVSVQDEKEKFLLPQIRATNSPDSFISGNQGSQLQYEFKSAPQQQQQQQQMMLYASPYPPSRLEDNMHRLPPISNLVKRLSVAAWDLLGKSEMDLTLQLIQLNREEANLKEWKKVYEALIAQNLQVNNSHNNRELHRYRELLEDVDKQLELSAPLKEFIDHILKMSKMHKADELLPTTINHRQTSNQIPLLKNIEFMRGIQEKKIAAQLTRRRSVGRIPAADSTDRRVYEQRVRESIAALVQPCSSDFLKDKSQLERELAKLEEIFRHCCQSDLNTEADLQSTAEWAVLDRDPANRQSSRSAKSAQSSSRLSQQAKENDLSLFPRRNSRNKSGSRQQPWNWAAPIQMSDLASHKNMSFAQFRTWSKNHTGYASQINTNPPSPESSSASRNKVDLPDRFNKPPSNFNYKQLSTNEIKSLPNKGSKVGLELFHDDILDSIDVSS